MKHIYITMMMTALLIAGGHHAFAAKRPLITDIVSFEKSDEALAGELFINDVDDLNHLPLPGNAPYLTETGVVFLYTQYEIAPYSSGIITFEIPFKDIRPFLTPDAQKLIPSE